MARKDGSLMLWVGVTAHRRRRNPVRATTDRATHANSSRGLIVTHPCSNAQPPPHPVEKRLLDVPHPHLGPRHELGGDHPVVGVEPDQDGDVVSDPLLTSPLPLRPELHVPEA